MEQRLYLPFTETICYLQFLKNTIDTDLAQKSIQVDLKNLNPEAEIYWILYGKMSWEVYSKNKFKKKKEEF